MKMRAQLERTELEQRLASSIEHVAMLNQQVGFFKLICVVLVKYVRMSSYEVVDDILILKFCDFTPGIYFLVLKI
jgi:hypothetical protein